MMWLLVVEVVAVGGFAGVQVSGLVARGGRLLKMFGVIGDTAYAETLDRALRDYYRRSGGGSGSRSASTSSAGCSARSTPSSSCGRSA